MAYRDKEQQREYNRRYKREQRARQRLQQQSTPSSVPVPVQPKPESESEPQPGQGQEQDALHVVVNAGEESPKLSLKERILKKLQAEPTPTKAKRGKAKDEKNILTSTLPILLSSFIATYAQNALPDEYKACAPSREEVTAILSPIMNIIGRRLEVTGKISQDATDVLAALLATVAYGTRAYILYTDIKKLKAEGFTVEHKQQYTVAYRADEQQPGNYQATGDGLARHADSRHQFATVADGAANHGEYSSAGTDIGATEGRDREALIIADLFARDKQGRVRLGLLKPDIRESA
jgi:hypothetical protein